MAIDLTAAKQNVNNAELALTAIIAALEDLESRVDALENPE